MRLAVRMLLLAVLASVGVAPGAAATPSPTRDHVTVRIDQPALRTTIGERFRLTSTVRNDGDRPLTGLAAHLDVLSVDPDVYVDPEDWSAQRTVYLDPLPAHGSVPVPWKVQVVNDGRFVVFVTVTRQNGPALVDASDGLRLSATAQHTINAGGVLPLVLGIPAALLALLLLLTARRRRQLA
ncbi:MAG: hypothetical protein M3Q98_09810 [Actinomycetota bacterium]|nr:hypothetical protein [Actinomycetota bacterium]